MHICILIGLPFTSDFQDSTWEQSLGSYYVLDTMLNLREVGKQEASLKGTIQWGKQASEQIQVM